MARYRYQATTDPGSRWFCWTFSISLEFDFQGKVRLKMKDDSASFRIMKRHVGIQQENSVSWRLIPFSGLQSMYLKNLKLSPSAKGVYRMAA